VNRDKEKATHYWKLAAMGGSVEARYNLGCEEANLGNLNRRLKHFMIAVKDGCNKSLKNIKILYSDGHATKDEYAKALRSYQAFLEERSRVIKETKRQQLMIETNTMNLLCRRRRIQIN